MFKPGRFVGVFTMCVAVAACGDAGMSPVAPSMSGAAGSPLNGTTRVTPVAFSPALTSNTYKVIELVGVDVDYDTGIVDLDWFINRGIDTAARISHWQTTLEVGFVYVRGGQSVSETLTIDVADTVVRDSSGKNVVIEATVTLSAVPDEGTEVLVSTLLIDGQSGLPMAGDNLFGLIGVDLDSAGIVLPCWYLNRGIDTAAREGEAPFRLVVTIVYTAHGMARTQQWNETIAVTALLGPVASDPTSVRIEASIQLAEVPDQGTEITLTTQLVQGGGLTPGDPIGEPVSGTFPI